MSRQPNRQPTFQDECSIYIRFPVQKNSDLDENVAKKLFGQFGGLQVMVMKPDVNYAFAIYEKTEYALYVCELLNGISFMNGTLVVKPRDNTKNAHLFRNGQWARPNYQNQPVYYDQLNRIPFENFDPSMFLNSDN